MSGIAGIVYSDGRPVDHSNLKQMNDALAHRGLDDFGVWCEGSVGFGHRMFWTTPESLKEKQPFVDSTGKLAITADARIDNRDELCGLLGLSQSAELSDSSLILSAYEKWGEDCPQKLVGDFSFAIWDERANALFAARDRIGIKPFYYHRKGLQTFVFASEISPLFQAAELEKRPCRDTIEQFLTEGNLSHQCTLFEGIYRLPPATSLLLKNGQLRLNKYWQPSSGHSERTANLHVHAEEFRELLTLAIKSQLRSAYPVGCLLSGGLDSSSILCLASRLVEDKQSLAAYSMVFDQLPCDERKYIEEVIQSTGVDWVSTVVDGKELDAWELLQACYDRQPEWPVQDLPASVTLWPLTDAAQQQGARVMLTGVGGDQIAQGSTLYLADLLRTFRFLTLFRELRHYRFSQNVIRAWMVNPLVPKWILQARHQIKQRRGSRDSAWYLSTGDNQSWHSPYSLPKREFASIAAWQQACWIGDPLLSLYLDGWWDPLGSHAQLEFRHPFFDVRMIEFMQQLPAEEKFWRGLSKIVLRQGMKGILPESIRNRTNKAEFSPIVGLALRAMEIDSKALALGQMGFVESSRVEALTARYRSEKSAQWLVSIWRLARLEAWYKRHFASTFDSLIV